MNLVEQQVVRSTGSKTLSSDNSETGITPVVWFVGIAFFSVWRNSLMFLPMSPFMTYLGTDWFMTATVFGIVLVPFIFATAMTDFLSSNKRMVAAAVLSGVSIMGAALFLESMVSIVLLAVAACLMQIVYDVCRGATSGTVGVSAGCYFVSLVVMIVLALFVPQYFNWVILGCALISVAFFFLFYRVTMPDWNKHFVKKKDSKARQSFFIHNPLVIFGKSFLSGIAVACLFNAGFSTDKYFLVFGVIMLLVGTIIISFSKMSGLINPTTVTFMLAFISIPFLLLAVFLNSTVLAYVAAAELVVIFTLKFYNLKEGTDLARFNSGIEIYFFGKDHAYGCAGLLTGLYATLFLMLEGTEFQTAIYFGVILYVMVLVTIFYLGKHLKEKDDFIFENSSVDEISDKKGVWRKKVDAIAQNYKLSKRQTEVLELLARGRNAAYIRDHFVISNSTAKAHIFAIYKKTHVHSHQELIDLIERTKTK